MWSVDIPKPWQGLTTPKKEDTEDSKRYSGGPITSKKQSSTWTHKEKATNYKKDDSQISTPDPPPLKSLPSSTPLCSAVSFPGTRKDFVLHAQHTSTWFVLRWLQRLPDGAPGSPCNCTSGHWLCCSTGARRHKPTGFVIPCLQWLLYGATGSPHSCIGRP
jgi:hypothetical protein